MPFLDLGCALRWRNDAEARFFRTFFPLKIFLLQWLHHNCLVERRAYNSISMNHQAGKHLPSLVIHFFDVCHDSCGDCGGCFPSWVLVSITRLLQVRGNIVLFSRSKGVFKVMSAFVAGRRKKKVVPMMRNIAVPLLASCVVFCLGACSSTAQSASSDGPALPPVENSASAEPSSQLEVEGATLAYPSSWGESANMGGGKIWACRHTT